jgi:hypothetical protein
LAPTAVNLNESGNPFAYRGGRSRSGAAVVTASGSRRRAEIGGVPRGTRRDPARHGGRPLLRRSPPGGRAGLGQLPG